MSARVRLSGVVPVALPVHEAFALFTPSGERAWVEGWVPELASDAEVREALEKAFDYRGDITITRKDGSKVEGVVCAALFCGGC